MHAYLSTQGGDLAPDGPGPSGAAAALPLFPSPRALPHFLPPLDAALDLDWFAVDPLLFEPDPGLGAQAPAGRLAAAPQVQARPAAVYTHQAGASLRCLDPSHADGCTRRVSLHTSTSLRLRRDLGWWRDLEVVPTPAVRPT